MIGTRRRPLNWPFLVLGLVGLGLFQMPTATAAQTGRQGVIRGQVMDDAQGEGVSLADVRILDDRGRTRARALTNATGHFSLGPLPAGPFRIRVDRLGYAQVTTPLWYVEAGEVLTVTVRIHPEAIVLAPLEVVARTRSESPVLSGFYARADRGLGGVFIQRADIERIAPARVSDLLTTIPGVQLSGSGTGLSRTVTMARALPGAGGGACPVEIFLDGVRASNSRLTDPAGIPIDDLVSLADLEGLEIYRGLAGVPAEFLTPGARCGVIAIWTRRGG
jgi:hypothetical protein